MKAQIPLGNGRFVVVEVPADVKFAELPKIVAQIIAWLKTVCASTSTND